MQIHTFEHPMKPILHTLLITLLSTIGCTTANQENYALEVIDYSKYQEIVEQNKDKLLVVNFWATWCKPCVEELPHFMEVNQQFAKNSDYKMILISLDKSDLLSTAVSATIQKLKLKTDLYILSDNKRMNEWIPAIDNTWSGAIPATVFYKNGKQTAFVEGQLTKKELTETIKKHL